MGFCLPSQPELEGVRLEDATDILELACWSPQEDWWVLVFLDGGGGYTVMIDLVGVVWMNQWRRVVH